MTTINNYAVGLSLDASKYIRGSSLSRQETNKLKREINSARTPAENYERSLRTIEKAYKSGAIDAGTYNRLLDQQKTKLNAASKASGGLVKKLGALALGFASFQRASQFLTDGIGLAAEAEQLGITFEVLTKDAEVSARLIGQLRSFAAATPFQSREIMQSARNLLAFGSSANSVVSELKNLGNISAATNTRMTELTEIIGKMRVQGTIMSEDLNQLAGRGINVFDGLAERLGTTTDKVKKFASQGKISFQDLKAVLDDLATNDFGGMMERQSESILGKWSTFNDELSKTKRLLGEIALGDGSGMTSLGGFARQFNKGLDVLMGSPAAKQMQADATKEAAAAARKAAEMRNGVNLGAIEAQVRERQFAAFAGRGQGFQGLAGDAAAFGSNVAKGAGAGLLGGFRQLGETIKQGFLYNATTIRKAVVVEGPAASLEVGSQEAYQFLTSSTDIALKAEQERAKKAETQRKLQLEAQNRGNSLLADLMNKFNPIQKAR